MKIQWANEVKTLVQVDVMGMVFVFPTQDGHKDWDNIKDKVASGELVIDPYRPVTSGVTSE